MQCLQCSTFITACSSERIGERWTQEIDCWLTKPPWMVLGKLTIQEGQVFAWFANNRCKKIPSWIQIWGWNGLECKYFPDIERYSHQAWECCGVPVLIKTINMRVTDPRCHRPDDVRGIFWGLFSAFWLISPPFLSSSGDRTWPEKWSWTPEGKKIKRKYVIYKKRLHGKIGLVGSFESSVCIVKSFNCINVWNLRPGLMWTHMRFIVCKPIWENLSSPSYSSYSEWWIWSISYLSYHHREKFKEK